MTDKSASFIYVTFIRTTAEKLFEAITRPEISRRYWGYENVSEDWQPGSDWQHVKVGETRTVELVGKVIESAPPTRLVISWANESQKDDPDQYSRVTYDIEAQGDMVKLTVSHDELQPGSGMLKGITEGWPIVLSSMKSFLETGQGLDI